MSGDHPAGARSSLSRRALLAGAASAVLSTPLLEPAALARVPSATLPGAPFRPPPGRTLVFAGQWPRDLGGLPGRGLRNGYLDRVSVTPAGITTYGSLPPHPRPVPRQGPLAGNPVRALLRQPRLRHCVLHLSLPWVPHDFAVDDRERNENLAAQRRLLDGDLDPWIDAYADWCAAQRRPILLRPGYEFERFPDDRYYDRRLYAPAFRRIVRRFRARRARNVAFVWASGNIGWGSLNRNLFDSREPDRWDFDAWYPGDRYVDWFGFSMWSPVDPDTIMMREARRRGKPVLLAETTPATFNLRSGRRFGLGGENPVALSSGELWEAWFEPFLRFVRRNGDVVAGWHYIATDWTAQPGWAGAPPFIGCDSRLWENPEILRRWHRALRRPGLLSGSPRLWSRLGAGADQLG